MDSINRQQPEKNFENLSEKDAREKIKELIGKAKNTCFFCTNIKTGEPFSTRPMSVQKIDDDGTLWFLSSIDSHKNEHLLHDSAVQLLFRGSGVLTILIFLQFMATHLSAEMNKKSKSFGSLF